jgi:biopolymer transport protein ExbD
VDIIFLLIIFFLVSSTFEKSEQQLGVKLPSTRAPQEKVEQKDPESWILLIDKNGTFFFNDDELSEKAFEEKLRRNQGRRENIQVVVKADHRVPYGNVAKVLGLLGEFSYQRVSFRTLKIKE